MVTRYCSKCGEQIILDDSRAFGFCTYCGTKIELAPQPGSVSSGADPLDAEIQQKEKEAQAFVKLGNWEKARELMLNLANGHPDSGRAWLAFEMVFAQPPEVILKEDLFKYSRNGANYRVEFPFTADTVMKWLQNEILVNTKKTLREDEMPLYRQRIEAYQSSLKEEFRRSDRIIDDLIQYPTSLAGYSCRAEGEYNPGYQGFFEDDGSLYYADFGDYSDHVFRLIKSEGEKLIFEIAYRSGGISRGMNSWNKESAIQGMRNTPRYWEFRPTFANESTLYIEYSTKLLMDKAMADEHLKKSFHSYVAGRIKAKRCPICGSEKGFLSFGGCPVDCMSLFKK